MSAPAKKKFKSVDEYIALFPAEVQKRLSHMRKLVLKLIPDTEEYLGYEMPGYKYKGKAFIYFAAFDKHIGLYGMNIVPEPFREEASKYKSGKGSIQFPHNQEMPWEMIEAIIKFKVENKM